MELLIEELPAPEPIGALLARLHDGALAARRVCLATGEVSLHPAEGRVELILVSSAFYVGALGSRRTARTRCQRLARMGLTAAQLARLHGPAGVPIGSKRPAEIALSILAEVTAARNGVTGMQTR